MYYKDKIDVTTRGKGKRIPKKPVLIQKAMVKNFTEIKYFKLANLSISNLLILAFTSRDDVTPCSLFKHIGNCPPGHYCEDSSSKAECM